MPKVKISTLELDMPTAGEVLRMGGPYVGDLWFGDKIIIKQCVADNYVYDENRNLLFYIKYHKINYYEYFTINFYHMILDETCEFTREFEMVYIKQLINDHELEIYHAFHDKFPERRLVFNLDEEDMVTIE